jgi:CRP-like cAMP-binding protein
MKRSAYEHFISELIELHLLTKPGVQRLEGHKRNATIFHPGQSGRSFYFVRSGSVKLLRRGANSRELLLTLVHPGEIFGQEALLTKPVRRELAQIGDPGEVFDIPCDTFRNFASHELRAWPAMTQYLLARQVQLEKRIESLLLHDVERRILAVLHELAGRNRRRAQSFSIELSQRELAALVCATRETTSTLLNSLERRGLVELGRRRLTVNSVAALRHALQS